MSRRTLVVPLLLALGACASNPTSSLDAFAARSANNSFEPFDRSVQPPDTLVLQVSHDRQTTQAACGAHALSSVINYWEGEGTVTGLGLFEAAPPADAREGYSMTELMAMARAHGLTTNAVRLRDADIIRELEAGRPVLVPVRVPSIFIQPWQLPGANMPVIGIPSAVVQSRVGMVAEFTRATMVNHYILIVGYENRTYVAVEPVMGFRTISFERLDRYRQPFGNAALVFSGSHPRPANGAVAAATPTG